MNRSSAMVRSIGIISAIATCIALLTMCMGDQSVIKPIPQEIPQEIAYTTRHIDFSEFTGSQACRNCHANIYRSHTQTSHFKTSLPATEKSIRGSFKNGQNTFYYNPELYVAMEKKDTGLYQVVYYQGDKKLSLSFGITIGSGNKGQSYMYWEKNRLFQMPITYYSIARRWANSPGFPNKVQYERPITARCMECHNTFAGISSPPGKEPEEFDHNKIIYGVDCEKCHGPGKRHVDFQTQNPRDTTAKFIINPARLTRQQNLDLCALCHGGRLERKQPSFTFISGDTLSQFFKTELLNKTERDYASVDVHGNQYGLMSASRCFIKSNMTCNTCHNSHENERGKLALYSSRCQTCHSGEHKATPQLNSISRSVIKSNCIDCHMASETSHAIVLYTSGMEAPKAATFRSHLIKVYPDETIKFIERIKSDR